MAKTQEELNVDELKKVTGGWSQNDDGTYNIYKGDTFLDAHMSYTPMETVLNATLGTSVLCD